MMQLRPFRLFLLLVAALGLATIAHANGPIGDITGIVLDSQGKPVVDATVTLQTSDGNHPHATHTDADGHFKFERYETGQYDLRAFSNGMFSEWAKRVTIRSKKTTHVSLRMPPPADISMSVKH